MRNLSRRAWFRIVGKRIIGGAANMVETQQSLHRFQFFGLLTEDLQVSILSFVADAPFENSLDGTGATPEDIVRACRSPLTNVLPLVSKQFHQYSQHDVFWKAALHRLLQKDYDLWKNGLLQMLHDPNDDTAEVAVPVEKTTASGANAEGANDAEDSPKSQPSPSVLWSFLEKVHDRCGGITYTALFQSVVCDYLRCKAPIFYMPGHVTLQETFRLHFFEPRYRLMIAELLTNHPQPDRQGIMIPESRRPTFLYVFDGRPPPAAGKPACLVQITKCFLYENGTADVECLPVDYVYLENVWIRHDRSHLFMGQSRRLGQSWKKNLVTQNQLPQQLGRWLERIVGLPFVIVRHEGTENHRVEIVQGGNAQQDELHPNEFWV